MSALGMLETPEKGAMTTINCAVNPDLAGTSGVYYVNCKPAQPSQLARQVILAWDQWEPWPTVLLITVSAWDVSNSSHLKTVIDSLHIQTYTDMTD